MLVMADGAVQGSTHERYAPVRAQFEANLTSGADIGASFCATVEGETVVDLWAGFADPAKTRPWVRDTIEGMTIEEKIGQLFVNLNTAFTPAYLDQVLDTYHVGGMRFRGADAFPKNQ